MLIYALIISVVLILIILTFTSRRLSPIPYFPSNRQDLPLIVMAFKLKKNQVIFDLGAGDGIVIFAAAKEALQKKLNTKFIAVEINPILIFILHLRRLFHSNKRNIKIIRADIFKMNLRNASFWGAKRLQNRSQQRFRASRNDASKLKPRQTWLTQFNNVTIYLYISPWFLEKVIENCKLKIENFSVVSYMYPIISLKQKEKIIRGKNSIFIYDFQYFLQFVN